MSTKTSTVLADLPQVNLLPPEIHENREFRRLLVGLVGVVALSVVGVGAVYVHGKSSVQDATKTLAADQLKQVTLERDLNKLQYVVTSGANVATAEAALAQARSTNIRWADVLADLSSTLPTRAWYTGLSLTESVGAGTLPNVGAAPDNIGTVSFAGYARVHDDMATWLDNMSKVSYFSHPYFSTSAEQMIGSTKVVQFNSTVDLNSTAIHGCDTPGVC